MTEERATKIQNAFDELHSEILKEICDHEKTNEELKKSLFGIIIYYNDAMKAVGVKPNHKIDTF